MLNKRVHVNGRSEPRATTVFSVARRLISILVLGNAAVLCSAAGLRGQGNGAIEGRVSDEQGRPLSEVLLTVDGTSLSALTDDAGSFSLARVPGGGQQLPIPHGTRFGRTVNHREYHGCYRRCHC